MTAIQGARPVSRRAAALAVTALLAYVAAVVLANVLTDHFEFVPVWFGVSATAGTYAAGAALFTRDLLQDAAGRRAVLAAILIGAAVSWGLSSPALAAASGAAFLVAELADMAVYTPLRRRGRWAYAVLASNTVGAVVDTFLFLWLAGFPIWQAAPGQLIGKLLWATLLPLLLVTAGGLLWKRQARSKAVTQ